MIATEEFKVEAPELAVAIMKVWLRRNWWVLALAPALSIVLAAAGGDMRFVYVALILLFLVLPPVMIGVYFYHALAPETRLSVLSHRVIMEPDGLRVEYAVPADDDGEVEPRPDDFIALSEIRKVVAEHGRIIYRLDRGVYSLMIVPASAFKSPGDCAEWLRRQRSLLNDRH